MKPQPKQKLPSPSFAPGPFDELGFPTIQRKQIRPRIIISFGTAKQRGPPNVGTCHEYLFISIYRACAESLASENASRLAAMQRADKNIDELLETLHTQSHRQRQGSIDEELFDVISGFDALSS